MNIIREYYETTKLPSMMIDRNVAMFDKHPDIKKEFEHWIQTKEYIVDNAVSAEKYTAKSLSEMSEFLDGEGAFSMLIQLRETPELALKKISRGFKIK